MPGSRSFQCIFFDLGGTLIDFQDPAGWTEAARSVGVELDAEHLAHCYEEVDLEADAGPLPTPATEFWRRVLERSSGTAVSLGVAQEFELLLRRLPPGVHLYSDVTRCLRQLASDGRKLGIISNSSSAESVREYLRGCEIDRYFDWIVSSGTEGVEKPDPAIFLRAIARASTTPARAFHVGDQPNRDARAARRAGMQSVWLNRRGTGFGEDPPEITSLTELPGLLRVLERGE
ncbi:MAG: HAD family hydrolase [Thermoplasmata archaeon]|nr:HAD family hydrolase [Thermoplasmata archaeon]